MNEFEKRLIDYFDPWDLVEVLGITTAELVVAFEDEVKDKAEELEELMEYGTYPRG